MADENKSLVIVPVGGSGNLEMLKSRNVKVFPGSYRGDYTIQGEEFAGQTYAFDPESRMTTEYNLANIPGFRSDEQNTYIISFGEYHDMPNTLRCVIGGYYFEIYNLNLEELLDTTNPQDIKTKKLCIKTREVSLKEGVDSLTGAVRLDMERYTYILSSWLLQADVSLSGNNLDELCSGEYVFTGIKVDSNVSGTAYLEVLDPISAKQGQAVLNNDAKYPILFHGMGVGSIRTDKSCRATGDRSFAHGNATKAFGDYSFTEGAETEASGEAAHAEGLLTRAAGDYSHSEGHSSVANATYAHAEGENTLVEGADGHAEGVGTFAKGHGAHAEGGRTNTSVSVGALGEYSHTEGLNTKVTTGGANSHAEGEGTSVAAKDSHAEGKETSVTASSDNSHAEGYKTTAANKQTHAEGNTTKASGENSHAEGLYSQATGKTSHAEGIGTDTKYTLTVNADANAKVYTTASGTHGLTAGDILYYGTDFASVAVVVAIDGTTKFKTNVSLNGSSAWTNYSLVFYKNNNIAKGEGSHVEGLGNLASGKYSHAEGKLNHVSGEASLVTGQFNIASGIASFVTGKWNRTTRNNQTVVGKFNKEEDGEFIVGIGAADDDRKNALVVKDVVTTIKHTLKVNDNSDTTKLSVTPTQTDITTATNNITGTTNTITGTTNTLKVGNAEKIKTTSTDTTLSNTNLTSTATETKFNVGDTTKVKIVGDATTLTNTKNELVSGSNKITLKSSNGTTITGNAAVTGTLKAKGTIQAENGTLVLGFANESDAKIQYKDIYTNYDILKIRRKDVNGVGVLLGGKGLTAVIAGEGGGFETETGTAWGTENLYLISDQSTYICANTNDDWASRKTWEFNKNGVLNCPGTINGTINITVPAGEYKDILYAKMASNDYARICVGGDTNAGELEIATADDATEPIVFRQYQSVFGSPKHVFYALNGDGITEADKLKVNDEFKFNGGKISMYKTDSDAGIFNINNNLAIKENGYLYTKNSIRADGEISADSFDATSDARLKENIREYKSDKSILDLPIYKYDFINGAKDQVGCLAQDLQQIAPELVVIRDDGYLAIKESKLAYLLIDEIKKLKKEIEELKRGK